MARERKRYWRDNPNLKNANVEIQYTEEQLEEYLKCSEDPIYFMRNYCKVVHVDRGLVPFKLYDFQEEYVQLLHSNRFVISKLSRQCGKSTTTVSYLLWVVLFKPMQSIAILSNKASNAKDMLGKLQLAYEHLPFWLQQGVITWNKTSIELENKSKIIATSTASNSARGGTYNCISGESEIVLRNTITNEIIKIPIEELYANSSRRMMTTKYSGEHDKQQIQEVVFFNDGESQPEKSSTQYTERESSCNPTFIGRKRRSTKQNEFDNTRTFACTQTIDKIFNGQRKSQNVPRLFSDVRGATRRIGRTFRCAANKIIERIWGGSKSDHDRTQTLGRNEEKDRQSAQRKNSLGRTKTLSVRENERPLSWEKDAKRVWRENFSFFNRPQKIKRLGQKDQQQSRENSKNSRKAPGHETQQRVTETNERGGQRENQEKWRALEQRIEIGEWEVYTTEGFKSFRGISRTKKQSVLTITTEHSQVTCTSEHKIGTTTGFIEARNLSMSDSVICSGGREEEILSIKLSDDVDVYDLLDVQDTHSFFANDILVHNCIVLDEFAFVPRHIADEFFTSVYPTISSGSTTKCFIISTPNGMNLFYRLWSDAENKRNRYIPFTAHWSQVPGRDEKWKEETIQNIGGYEKFLQEFEVEFLGSSDTLISAMKLKEMAVQRPVFTNDKFRVYEKPQEKHSYVISVDPSEGAGQDYHAFNVIDVTQIPYKQVATYRDNEMSTLLLPHVIYSCAKEYNEASILVETNNTGSQVVDLLHYELRYQHIIKTVNEEKKGTILAGGFNKRAKRGLRTTSPVKNIGCANLKSLIEFDKLIVHDENTILELTAFVSNGKTYAAEEGAHDDLVMSLVLFAWMSNQKKFKELTNTNIRDELYKQEKDQMRDKIMPFIVDDQTAMVGQKTYEVDASGQVWEVENFH